MLDRTTQNTSFVPGSSAGQCYPQTFRTVAVTWAPPNRVNTEAPTVVCHEKAMKARGDSDDTPGTPPNAVGSPAVSRGRPRSGLAGVALPHAAPRPGKCRMTVPSSSTTSGTGTPLSELGLSPALSRAMTACEKPRDTCPAFCHRWWPKGSGRNQACARAWAFCTGF